MSVPVRVFSKIFNWGRKIHPECGFCYPCDWLKCHLGKKEYMKLRTSFHPSLWKNLRTQKVIILFCQIIVWVTSISVSNRALFRFESWLWTQYDQSVHNCCYCVPSYNKKSNWHRKLVLRSKIIAVMDLSSRVTAVTDLASVVIRFSLQMDVEGFGGAD